MLAVLAVAGASACTEDAGQRPAAAPSIDGREIVLAAATTTCEVSTGRTVLRLEVEGSDGGGLPLAGLLPSQVETTFDLGSGDLGSGDLGAGRAWSRTEGEAIGGGHEVILDGDVVYVRGPLAVSALGLAGPEVGAEGPDGAGTWLRFDPPSEGSAQEDGLGALLGDTLCAQVGTLREAGEVTELGTRTLDGVETTGYRVDLATPSATEGKGGGEGPFSSLLEGLDLPSVDVWIGDDGIVREMRSTFTAGDFGVQQPATEGLRVTTVLEVSDLGDPVEIPVPPADQVIDMSLPGLLGGGSS